MIFAIEKRMTASRIKLFWREIDLIQARHALFFSKDQKRHISIIVTDSGAVLRFSEEYNLPKVITLEVEFAFRLTSGQKNESKEDWNDKTRQSCGGT